MDRWTSLYKDIINMRDSLLNELITNSSALTDTELRTSMQKIDIYNSVLNTMSYMDKKEQNNG